VQYIHDGLMKRRNVRMTDNSVVTSDLWYRYDMGWNALASYDLGTDGTTAWDIGTRAQSVAYLGMTPLAEAPTPPYGASLTWSKPPLVIYRHLAFDSRICCMFSPEGPR